MLTPRSTSILPVALLCCLAAGPPLAEGQATTDLPAAEGGEVRSLGMPSVYKGQAGALAGWDRPAGEGGVAAFGQLGVSRDFGNPITGILAFGLEGYLGIQSNELGAGGRAILSIPAFHIGSGLDYNITDDEFDWLVRLEVPFRRGGIFGRGTQVRIDWLPTRDQTFAVGISAPLWGRNIGKTRPSSNHVELRRPPLQRLEAERYAGTEGLTEALGEVRLSARRVTAMTLPIVDRGGEEPREAQAKPIGELRAALAMRSLPAEIAHYHAEIDRVFSIASGAGPLGAGRSSERGVRVAGAARQVLLDSVLLPYNRLLGQRKTTFGLDQFRAVAHSTFASWVLTESGLPRENTWAAFGAFQSLVDIVDEILQAELRRWEDSRLVWLPLQLAVRPEDHDTQPELDALMERATGGSLTAGNHVWYVMNENFQLELSRSVLRARDYHVLWIHDYRGLADGKRPDRVAFAQAVDSYLAALIERVKAYDETGRLPVYMIFLDQHYFEANQGRLFLRLLSEPLTARLDLPREYAELETRWKAAQAELSAAVSASRLLRVQRSQYGKKWLQNLVKVHVNITNPSDFSFQSFHMIGIIPTPDNIIRDHRKIALYDINDDDPYSGMAMYTGMGIGEHYTGANWEDRAILIQGPATRSLRDAARGLLLAQGFVESEIPLPLRKREKSPGYDARVEQERQAMLSEWGANPGRVMELHNETGYAPKPIDLQKAILYTMMPEGSTLSVPDSLWQSYVYASMLAGSALRGCRVRVIAPALATAPSSAPPTMARAHGLLSALLHFRNELSEAIAASGGQLRVGLYAPRFGVGDLRGRMKQSLETHAGAEEPRIPGATVEGMLARLDELLKEAGYDPEYLVNTSSTERPKLHLKANLFLSARTRDALANRAETEEVALEYIRYLAQQAGPARDRLEATEMPAKFTAAVKRLATRLSADVPADEKPQAIAYMTVGSTNMNYRSMVMDGEVQVLFTAWQCLIGLLDFWFLEGLTEWIEDRKRLDELLPPPGGMTRNIANLMRLAL